MFRRTDVEFKYGAKSTLIIMNLYKDGDVFSARVKIGTVAALNWSVWNVTSEHGDLKALFTDEAWRLYMKTSIDPSWDNMRVSAAWCGKVLEEYTGFYDIPSVKIAPHGLEFTISPEKTSKFLDLVKLRCKRMYYPAPQFNVAEILTFIEKGDNV